jgi:hypothetical protein
MKRLSALAAALVAISLAGPANAVVKLIDPPGFGGGSGQPLPLNNGSTGNLVPATPDPTAVSFNWRVSDTGLVWFGNTITSVPGGVGGAVIMGRTDGGLFQFAGVDHSLASIDPTTPLFDLRVQGFRAGNVVGTTLLQPTALGTFFTSGAGALAGIDIDELRFSLPGSRLLFDEEGVPIRYPLSMSIRNPNLTTADLLDPELIPEPASWALMIAGFGIVGAALRRRPLQPA